MHPSDGRERTRWILAGLATAVLAVGVATVLGRGGSVGGAAPTEAATAAEGAAARESTGTTDHPAAEEVAGEAPSEAPSEAGREGGRAGTSSREPSDREATASGAAPSETSDPAPVGVAPDRVGAEDTSGGEPVSGGRREGGQGSGDGAAESQATGPEVERILARAERAYASLGSLRARFEQTIRVPLMNRERHGTGLWYQKGRGRFVMDFLEPPEDVIVADGTYLWLYYPSTNPGQVIRADLGSGEANAGTADVLARILAEARTAYRASYEARERVDDVPTHLLSLVPTGRSPYRRVRVWIGVEDDLVRRFEITEENETVRSVTLRDLEPGAALPDSLFRFEPPEDADVFVR